MSTATKLTLGSLDVTKISRLVVTRNNRAVRFMKERENIAHFISNHSSDELSEYPGGWASVVKGSDYLSLQIVAKQS